MLSTVVVLGLVYAMGYAAGKGILVFTGIKRTEDYSL